MDKKIGKWVNSVFASNTYCLFTEDCQKTWLVDVGDIQPILSCLQDCGGILQGVFLTHVHFDHIYGLNKLVELFPEIVVYTSAYGQESLYSDRLNFSRYHDTPFVFQGKNVVVLKEGEQIMIGGVAMNVWETPGHNPGCLCYKWGNYFFTGDSFIPGIKTVTNLRGGDKEANQLSLAKIRQLITADTVVCPGHGDMVRGCELVF